MSLLHHILCFTFQPASRHSVVYIVKLVPICFSVPDFPQDVAPKASLPVGYMMSKVLLEEFQGDCCSPTFQSHTHSASRTIHIVVGEW